MTSRLPNVGDLKQSIDPATIQVLAKDDIALVETWDNLLLQFEDGILLDLLHLDR
ncbi:hypothetical protein V1504DRAFT_434688 [Lipomyces starkeyi]